MVGPCYLDDALKCMGQTAGLERATLGLPYRFFLAGTKAAFLAGSASLLARSLPREVAPWTTGGLAFLGFLSLDIHLLEILMDYINLGSLTRIAWGRFRRTHPAQDRRPKKGIKHHSIHLFKYSYINYYHSIARI